MEKLSKKKNGKRELETHHNQQMTEGARTRDTEPQGVGQRRKVVALRLDEIEEKALDHLGGVTALKALLCPPGLCISCREKAAVGSGSLRDAYCEECRSLHQV